MNHLLLVFSICVIGFFPPRRFSKQCSKVILYFVRFSIDIYYDRRCTNKDSTKNVLVHIPRTLLFLKKHFFYSLYIIHNVFPLFTNDRKINFDI